MNLKEEMIHTKNVVFRLFDTHFEHENTKELLLTLKRTFHPHQHHTTPTCFGIERSRANIYIYIYVYIYISKE